MKQYLDLVKQVINKGKKKSDRTGTGTISIFGHQMRFNLKHGFPLLTTKFCNFRSIVYELLWFIRGDTNINFLRKNKVFIWNEWANNNGDLGPIYGKQLRNWETNNGKSIDQLNKIIHQLKSDPNSRRIIVSFWNVGELENMALAPCHVLFQLYVINKSLSCHVYQRSCDVFLGLPFNIASYSLLIHMLSKQCQLNVGELIWSGGDIHIYNNHIEQINLQLKRIPKKLPKLKIKNFPKSIFNYSFENFELIDYNPYPHIKAEVSI